MPNYGHLSLSCAKIERPSPLEKPSCKVQFFAQNRSRKYRQKVTAHSLLKPFSSAFQLRSQTAYVCFHRQKWVHTRLSEENRIQRLTRRNRGVWEWALSLPSDRSARSQTSPGRVSERRTLPLLGLGRGCSQRTQKAFGTAMRLCVSLFRGVAAPLGCVALTVEFLAFLLLLKTTIANSLTPWYYGVTKSESIG